METDRLERNSRKTRYSTHKMEISHNLHHTAMRISPFNQIKEVILETTA